jgi:pyridoxal phosphate enzyme (YggS family)
MAEPGERIDAVRLGAAVTTVREELAAAARVSGRAPDAVQLLVAGKYIDTADTPTLIAAGVDLIGENRLQQLQAKQDLVGDRVTFDFIGHLQRRKVREVLRRVRLIHSVDSVELAREIAQRAEGPTRVLVEINADEEPSKSGIQPSHLRQFMAETSSLEDLVIGGLMAMPSPTTRAEDSRAAFALVRDLRDALAVEWEGRHDFSDLSMGTSQDYVVAAQEGATIVRLGRGLIERGRA